MRKNLAKKIRHYKSTSSPVCMKNFIVKNEDVEARKILRDVFIISIYTIFLRYFFYKVLCFPMLLPYHELRKVKHLLQRDKEHLSCVS